MMRKIFKKWIMIAGGLCAGTFLVVGAGLLHPVKNEISVRADTAETGAAALPKSIDEVEVSMKAGATLRLQDYIGDQNGNGLTWTMQMSENDYKALQANYERFVFGILIAPYERHLVVPVTYESVFGAEPAYGYTVNDITYNQNCYEILNLRTGGLAESANSDDGYVFRASMVNVRDANASREFIGIGYVKCVSEDETVTWRFLEENDNVRSVASLAREMKVSGGYSDYDSVFDGYMNNVGSVVAGYSTGSVLMTHESKETPRAILGYDVSEYGSLKSVDETVGGVPGKYIHYKNNDSKFALVVRPTYKKTYYEELAVRYPDAYVGFNTYVDTVGQNENYILGGASPRLVGNTWQHQRVSLAEYIKHYDGMCRTGGFGWGELWNGAGLFSMVWNTRTIANLYIDELSLYKNQPLTDVTLLAADCDSGDLNLYEALKLNGVYEYYLVDDGVASKLSGGIIVPLEEAGKKTVWIVRILEDGVKEFVNTVEIEYSKEEDPNAWAEKMSGNKIAADFTDPQSSYIREQVSGKTYFKYNNVNWPCADACIVMEEIGGVNGRYAKFTVTSDVTGYKTVLPIYLPYTMDLAALKEFAATGLKLKVKLYIEATEAATDVYALEYDPATGALKDIGDSSRKRSVLTGVWQEIDIDIDDYIRLMEANGKIHNAQTKKKSVLGVRAQNPWTVYVSELYLELPEATESLFVTEKETIDFSAYVPTDGSTYECYKIENGVFRALDATNLTAGEYDFSIAVVKKENAVRTIFVLLSVEVSSAAKSVSEWLEKVNGDKTVADYTKGSYVEIFDAGRDMTYFQKNHSAWMHSNAAILTQEIGGVNGTYAKVHAAGGTSSGQTIPIYLPNTMDMAMLKEFAAMGYKLKVKIYIDTETTSVTVRTLEYNESTAAFKNVWESSRENQVMSGVWQEVEIDVNDYIRMCEALGNRYGEQIGHATSMLGIVAKGQWDLYIGEVYLTLPEATENVVKAKGETIDAASYFPADDEEYECYTLIGGIYAKVEGTNVTVNADVFELLVVRVTVTGGKYIRTIVKAIEVSSEASV